MKLGKLPAREGAIKLKLRDYLVDSKLPDPPESFGHESAITDWGQLGNDHYGDCVWAGAGHETMLWNQEAAKSVVFDDSSILSSYTAVTGFDPSDPSTDQGTDVQLAASYRKNTGIVDANGTRHTVAAYLAITPGDVKEHLLALYLFGAVGIGIRFPAYAMEQFQAGQPWSKKLLYDIQGGHYIPLVARRNGQFVCVTWGRLQAMTDSFFKTFNDESVVYLSPEMLNNGVSVEGFDLAQLQADLTELQA